MVSLYRSLSFNRIFSEHPSTTVLPVISELRQTPLFRIDVESSPANGLKKTSQVMVGKVQSVPSKKVGQVIDYLKDTAIISVNS